MHHRRRVTFVDGRFACGKADCREIECCHVIVVAFFWVQCVMRFAFARR